MLPEHAQFKGVYCKDCLLSWLVSDWGAGGGGDRGSSVICAMKKTNSLEQSKEFIRKRRKGIDWGLEPTNEFGLLESRPKKTFGIIRGHLLRTEFVLSPNQHCLF